MFDTIKGEFTKTPEQLDSKKLEQAKGLAEIFTQLRKFLYLFFSIMAGISFFGIAILLGVNFIIQIIIIILLIPYSLFKIRDYIRGTI
jgi:hypothetical protein